jgi:hypothetical protein
MKMLKYYQQDQQVEAHINIHIHQYLLELFLIMEMIIMIRIATIVMMKYLTKKIMIFTSIMNMKLMTKMVNRKDFSRLGGVNQNDH